VKLDIVNSIFHCMYENNQDHRTHGTTWEIRRARLDRFSVAGHPAWRLVDYSTSLY
jgi:hypothetical protein